MIKLLDKYDIAFLTFIGTIIGICLLVIVYGLGEKNQADRYRKEAIERNLAHYVVDSSGKTEFRWKAPARSQDNVNESLVYRISL
jgi:hypothetical protein